MLGLVRDTVHKPVHKHYKTIFYTCINLSYIYNCNICSLQFRLLTAWRITL